jgi:hypothetical protein
MDRKFFYVVSGVVTLLGVFMPLASLDNLYVNVHHIGGLTFLLYVLPLGIIALGILNIYKSDVKYLKVWFISIAIIGLVITGLAVSSGINYLNYMAQEQTRFNRIFDFNKDDSKQGKQQVTQGGLGFGGLLLFIGFGGTIVSAFLQKKDAINISDKNVTTSKE